MAAFSVLQKKSKFLFEKPIFFFQEKATFSTFWEILLIQLHPTVIIFIFSGFWKSHFLNRKTHIFCLKKAKFWTFWELLFIQSQCTASLLTLAFFLYEKFCSKWTHLFFSKPQIFEGFEDSYLFSCILVQVCSLCRFSKKILKIFEKPIYFFKQKT